MSHSTTDKADGGEMATVIQAPVARQGTWGASFYLASYKALAELAVGHQPEREIIASPASKKKTGHLGSEEQRPRSLPGWPVKVFPVKASP